MGRKPKIKSANLEFSIKQSWRDLTFFYYCTIFSIFSLLWNLFSCTWCFNLKKWNYNWISHWLQISDFTFQFLWFLWQKRLGILIHFHWLFLTLKSVSSKIYKYYLLFSEQYIIQDRPGAHKLFIKVWSKLHLSWTPYDPVLYFYFSLTFRREVTTF